MENKTKQIIERAKTYLEREKASITCGKRNFAYELSNKELELLVKKLEAYENADLVERSEAIRVSTQAFRYDGKFGLEEWRNLTPKEIATYLKAIPRFNPKGDEE